MMLDAFKWDPQVGDVDALAPFALVLPTATGQELARLAEALDAESVAAEREIAEQPALWPKLGLAPPLRRAMASRNFTPSALRVTRFDFHPTSEGWRISEANADVPGGYSEASNLARLMAEATGAGHPAGDPAARVADILATYRRVGLVSEPRWVEDRQIAVYLAHLLHARGCATSLLAPWQVRWDDGMATAGEGPLDAVFRFYQAELLPGCGARDWSTFLCGGRTPVANPAQALFSESKRFPLVWPYLKTSLPTWRTLLPESRHPLDSDSSWMLKLAYSNTGEAVLERRAPGRWRARVHPSRWVAQRRFESVPCETPSGQMHVCIGVYRVDGRACGLYGRLSARPVIDALAIDVAVLLG